MLSSAMMIKPALGGVIQFGSVIKETRDSIESITQLGRFFHSQFMRLISKKTFIIYEFDIFGRRDYLYHCAQLYLSSNSKRLSDAPVVRLSMTSPHTPPVELLPESYSVHDSKDGVTVMWTSRFVQNSIGSSHNQRGGSWGGSNWQRSLSLTYNRKDHLWVRDVYLKYVIEEARMVISNSHPFSLRYAFDNLELQQSLRDRNPRYLSQFANRYELYVEIGPIFSRFWLSDPSCLTLLATVLARGYNVDVHDLELTTVRTNYDLCQIIVSNSPRICLVVEDLNGSFEFLVAKMVISFNILNAHMRTGCIKPVLEISGDDAENFQEISTMRRSKCNKDKPDVADMVQDTSATKRSECDKCKPDGVETVQAISATRRSKRRKCKSNSHNEFIFN